MSQPKKLSALGAITSTSADSLVYVANTTDSGSSYAGKQITVANLLSSYSTTTQVNSLITAAVSNLVDGAPGALDTLNELAAAFGDDASFSTTITNMINANETHVDNMATLTGVAKDSTGLGTFSGSTIADAATVKTALQALETAVESAGSASSLAAVTTDASDLQTLTGVSDGNSDLGTFSGSTINDSVSIKVALQALETALEAVTLTTLGVTATAAELNVLDGITATTAELNYVDGVTSNVQTQLDAKTADGDNVNVLVANTTADTAPSSYYFLVCDSSTGAIKAIEKSFMEID